MTADGHPPGVAAWLAMNLERDEKGLRLRLDLDAIDAMLEDYFARDLWPVLEGGDGPQRRSVVIAGQSEVWSPAAINRAEQGAAARPNCLRVHRIPEAGHWLHVDAPSPLLDCLLSDLDATP